MGTKIDMTGFKSNHLTVLHISDKRTASGSIKWVCQCDCGKICEVDGTRLRSGMAKSCGCESKAALLKGRGNLFQDLTGQRFGALTVKKRCENFKYTSGTEVVQWLCQCDCGKETKVLAVNLTTGNTQSCGKCKENSHGNLKIDQILTQANIPFTREKRFNTCKDIGYLRFDFYVNNTYLIEFDGRQHFSNENTIFDTTGVQRRDAIKNQWCKENNIPLIRIPYTHLDKLCLQDLQIETSTFII